MEIKIIPKNDEEIIGMEVSGTELELLKLDRETKMGDLKFLVYNVEFENNKATFEILKDDFEIVNSILKEIEKEAKEELNND